MRSPTSGSSTTLAVNPLAQVGIPADALRIDADGAVTMPGIIDCDGRHGVKISGGVLEKEPQDNQHGTREELRIMVEEADPVRNRRPVTRI